MTGNRPCPAITPIGASLTDSSAIITAIIQEPAPQGIPRREENGRAGASRDGLTHDRPRGCGVRSVGRACALLFEAERGEGLLELGFALFDKGANARGGAGGLLAGGEVTDGLEILEGLFVFAAQLPCPLQLRDL